LQLIFQLYQQYVQINAVTMVHVENPASARVIQATLVLIAHYVSVRLDFLGLLKVLVLSQLAMV
jgi:hypothetical protein